MNEVIEKIKKEIKAAHVDLLALMVEAEEALTKNKVIDIEKEEEVIKDLHGQRILRIIDSYIIGEVKQDLWEALELARMGKKDRQKNYGKLLN